MLYSLGFLTAQFFFFFVAMWAASIFFGIHVLEHEVIFMRIWGVLLIPGLLLWLGGNQIGLNRILEHTDMTAGQKAAEHLMLLIVSPIAAPIETASAMYATLKWSSGNRHVEWIPTPK